MTDVGHTAGRTIFGHPIGLANLFGVELWERFSFYGMLTILGYYLYYSLTDGGLGLPKATATGIVGAYGGFVYLSTVLGGWVADRLLGMERTVFYGGVVVMSGHIALAAYFVAMLRSPKVSDVERTRVRAFIPLFIANAVFWSLFQQIFTVLARYYDPAREFAYFGIIGLVAVVAGVIVFVLSPRISSLMEGVH